MHLICLTLQLAENLPDPDMPPSELAKRPACNLIELAFLSPLSFLYQDI